MGVNVLLAAADPGTLHAILWLIALVLVVFGIVNLLQRQIVVGIVLIVVGLLIGPGGASITGL